MCCIYQKYHILAGIPNGCLRMSYLSTSDSYHILAAILNGCLRMSYFLTKISYPGSHP
jgi:hypothetical protein